MKKVQQALAKLNSLRTLAIKAASEANDARVTELPDEIAILMAKYEKVIRMKVLDGCAGLLGWGSSHQHNLSCCLIRRSSRQIHDDISFLLNAYVRQGGDAGK
eukprot:6723982-Alexandrium_andersonii.AAC.1